MKIPKNLDDVQQLRVKAKSEFNDEFLAELVISLWRLRKTLLVELEPSAATENSKALRALDRMISKLEERGLRLVDQAGNIYDEGMALRVIASEEREDLQRYIILETFIPSIFLRDNLIHAGEVVVGKPKQS